MATNGELQVDAWHDAKYGSIDPAATYRKLLEEIGEVGEALMLHDMAAVKEEIGDCQVVIRHLLRYAAGDAASLSQCMMVALDKCEMRVRRAAEAAGGKCEHKRQCPRCGRLCGPIGYDMVTTRVCFNCKCGEKFMAERRRDYLAGVGDAKAAEALGGDDELA